MWSSALSCLTRLFLPSAVVQYMTRWLFTTWESIRGFNWAWASRWSGDESPLTWVIRNRRYLFFICINNSKTFWFVSNVIDASSEWFRANRKSLVVIETLRSLLSSTAITGSFLISSTLLYPAGWVDSEINRDGEDAPPTINWLALVLISTLGAMCSLLQLGSTWLPTKEGGTTIPLLSRCCSCATTCYWVWRWLLGLLAAALIQYLASKKDIVNATNRIASRTGFVKMTDNIKRDQF